MDETGARLGTVARTAGAWVADLAGEPEVADAARALAAAATRAVARREEATRGPTGGDEAATGAGDRAAGDRFREALTGLTGGGAGGWRGELGRMLGEETPIHAGLASQGAIRARATPATAALAAAGPPDDRTAALLLASGLLPAYVGMAPAGHGELATARAAGTRTSARACAADALLEEPPPDEPARCPLWTGLIRGLETSYAKREERLRLDRLNAHLAACAAGDAGSLRAALAEVLVGSGDGGRDLAHAAAVALPEAERAALLAGRLETKGDEADRLVVTLARDLPAWRLRRLALRCLAAARPGGAPRARGPLWESLVGGSPGPRIPARPGGGISGPSRARCARWLLARGAPGTALALLEAGGRGTRGAGELDVLRALAGGEPGETARKAAWGLVEGGGGATDGELVARALGPGRGRMGDPEIERAAASLGHRPGPNTGEGLGEVAARAVLGMAAGGGSYQAKAALRALGPHLPGACVPLAAGLLGAGDEAAATEGAAFLVAHAPDLATAEALARAGLLTGAGIGADGALEAGEARLRRRADGALIPARGHRRGGRGELALRAADGALRRAWAGALDADTPGGPA